ncbi:DEAD/DEAH box helicase family protein [Kineococcus sp. SYSU DK001]|uniref:DEAD/DEAH box helicase family protein n=1 Tax=Kineococcus sp. SYSU DK001 TaxID=3383122 RepID=UPI003D7C6893
MTNFAFLAPEWLLLHGDCTRAESYLASDPRSACFYARRAAELLVTHLYELNRLPAPYRDDFSARLNDPAFQQVITVGIGQKLNLLRKVGNRAVHDTQQIAPRTALDVVRELHHVMLWAAFRYSTNPDAVPRQATFDPTIAAQRAPLSRDDVVKLAARFKQQDEEHAKALRERDDLAAAKDAEIAALLQQIAAAKAASTAGDDRDYDEATTRALIIDELLAEAGWRLDDERDREFEVVGMPNESGVGYVDYVLWGADGLPLAVVEAKRTTKDPAIGQQQAKLYADCLEAMTGRRPVILFTNGYVTQLWDDAAGYPPRKLQGFLTRSELELMVARRTTRLPLAGAAIDASIVGRPYQTRAIRAIDDAFTRKQRAALLVMATGAGKTRTTIALVKQLMEAGWVKRVLFLADRTALVKQAVGAFKEHLPNVATVNLVTEKITEGRVYASTYPTMMNLIDVTDGGERLFGPGYFDLIVVDEAHRSVYQKYRSIFAWFDSLLVGLTATPKDEVDRNTYELFHLEDGVPTDAYGLAEAIDDGFLVPAQAVAVPMKFLRHGITYDALSEQEKDDWDAAEWGEDADPPDAVAAEELYRFLFNTDTVDKVLAKLMADGRKVAGGDRLGKTVVFAKNQQHAEFIRERFDQAYPHLAGHFARVITHAVPYAQNLIDDFSQPDKAPHIAISVDMLDTGIDVPEIVNLVFFKTVRAKSKFWQMMGRGTRLRPDLYGPGQDKADFYVFDFCGNLEYFQQDLPETGGSVQRSLMERLFEARVSLVAGLDGQLGPEPADPVLGRGDQDERGLRTDTADLCRSYVSGMNLDNFLVRPQREWVELYGEPDTWHQPITPDRAGDIAQHLAGLPSSEGADEENAKRFDLLLLRLQLAHLDGDVGVFDRLRAQVQQIASSLLSRTSIPVVAAQAQLLDEVAGDEWWVDVPLPHLERVRRRVRDLVQFIEKSQRAIVYTNFADELGEDSVVDLPGITPGTNWERFREKTTAYLRQHEDHLALQRLRRNIALTADDLTALEQMLLESGAQDADITRASEEAQGLGLFIRSLVGLDRQAATELFAEFLDETTFSVDQVRFVQLVIDHLTANGIVEVKALYAPPFTDRAPHGPDSVFADEQVDTIVARLRDARRRALVEGAVA